MGSRLFPVAAIALLVSCGDPPPPTKADASRSAEAASPSTAAAIPTQSQVAPAATSGDPPTPAAAGSAGAVRERPAAPVDRQFQEGRHYERLTPQQPTVAGESDRVEVVEVFQYSCPACFNFEPHLTQWEQSKPDHVNFVRLPAPWNALSELHARAHYTAEVLGIADQIRAPMFREIHVNGNYLQTPAELADFFARFGVDAPTFTSTFDSFAVHTRMQRGRDLVQRYQISGTPEIVVNGRFRTGGQAAGSYEAWFEIINEIIAIEHAAAD